ncbi:unnamed protein product [Linum trigynum]|uniref:Uncharacterized protein n=1 Tax=Linum trigynum TaxID=586398 RepID=A0AAV2DXL9_9ROSI
MAIPRGKDVTGVMNVTLVPTLTLVTLAKGRLGNDGVGSRGIPPGKAQRVIAIAIGSLEPLRSSMTKTSVARLLVLHWRNGSNSSNFLDINIRVLKTPQLT